MSRAQDMKRLQAIAQLVLDQRLRTLNQAADRLERSREQLAAINAAASPADLSPVAAGLVDVAYQRWADVRRAELNGTIARQSAHWIESRGEAGQAFGRVQALDGALARLIARK
jgi:hypothetical protein